MPNLEEYNKNPKIISDFEIVGNCSSQSTASSEYDSECLVTDSAMNPILNFNNSNARDSLITLKKGLKNPDGRFLILIQSTQFTDDYTVFDFNFKTGLNSILKLSSPTNFTSGLGFGEADFDCLNSKTGVDAKNCFTIESDFQEYFEKYKVDQLKIATDLETLKPYLGDSKLKSFDILQN